MTDLIYFGAAAGLSVVLVACAIAFGVVQRRIRAEAAAVRREHLKQRVRAL